MAEFPIPGFDRGKDPDERARVRPPIRPPPPPFNRPGMLRAIVSIVLGVAVIYGAYFWFIRRIVVRPTEVLVLLKKNGTRSLPADQIIIPRAPDRAKDAAAYDAWAKQFADCNGIMEET